MGAFLVPGAQPRAVMVVDTLLATMHHIEGKVSTEEENFMADTFRLTSIWHHKSVWRPFLINTTYM